MSVADPPVCAAADPDVAEPAIVLPPGACDCHLHIFTTNATLVAERQYTPAPALLSSYLDLQKALGLERAVVVQPSVYGTDNTATLNAVSQGGHSFRAVVVVEPDITLQKLREMHERGARGVRINPLFDKRARIDSVQALSARLAELGWHIQFLIDVSECDDLVALVSKLAVPVVFDHFGHVPAGKGINDPGFQALLRLVGEGQAWVKLSGAYRITTSTQTPYVDISPFARALIGANPERVLWGSDWPHPHIPVSMPRDNDLIDTMLEWVPDASIRNRIFVDNPATLYEFAL